MRPCQLEDESDAGGAAIPTRARPGFSGNLSKRAVQSRAHLHTGPSRVEDGLWSSAVDRVKVGLARRPVSELESAAQAKPAYEDKVLRGSRGGPSLLIRQPNCRCAGRWLPDAIGVWIQ